MECCFIKAVERQIVKAKRVIKILTKVVADLSRHHTDAIPME